jgi:uncharacterized membrane protein YdjX (TVP38/TMEM64 family)
VIQALQVVIAPIPGEVTGLLGGYVFGQWLGFFYSTLGLTAGSLFAFCVGRARRRLCAGRRQSTGVGTSGVHRRGGGGDSLLHHLSGPRTPEGHRLLLFGISPMPFWVFAVVSTLGRMPGTWALSAPGGKAAAGEYVALFLLTAIVAAVAPPLYYYRSRIVSWLQRRR